MARPKSNKPYTVVKPKDKTNFIVKFKNEESGKWVYGCSTGTADRAEAEKFAIEWYAKGRENKKSVSEKTIIDLIRKTEITEKGYKAICEALKSKGGLSSFILKGEKKEINAYQFLIDDYNIKKSERLKSKKRSGKTVNAEGLYQSVMMIKKYWKPFLKDKMLGELTKQDMKEFVNSLQNIKTIGNVRRNMIIAIGFCSLRWAYREDLIESDITNFDYKYKDDRKETRILTPEIAEMFFSAEWNDKRYKLINLLAMITGMRSGEIVALQKRNLREDRIIVDSNYAHITGLKSTKNGKPREVFIAQKFQWILRALLVLAETNPYNSGMSAYIFWSLKNENKPLTTPAINENFRKQLVIAGFTEEESKQYRFYQWRHYHDTYMNGEISEDTLIEQSGHGKDMVKLYTNHQTSKKQKEVCNAQEKCFGRLIDRVVTEDRLLLVANE